MYYFFQNDDTIVWEGSEDTRLVARSQEYPYPLPEDAYGIKNYLNRQDLAGDITFTHKPVKLVVPADYPSDPAAEFIYNKVWVTTLIEFGLISELKSAEIEVWNAFFDRAVAITDFTDPGDAGISIDPVTTPTYVWPNGYEVYNVYVSSTGPAEQNTTYDWTVSLEEFNTNVTGTRLIPFPYKINWRDGEKITYEWHTAIYQSKTSHEQRRTLSDYPTRKSNLRLLLNELQAQRFANLMRYARGKFFAVPIYCETMTPQVNPYGASSIVPNEDIEFYWNLQKYCPYLTIYDYDNAIVEVKTVSSTSATTIYLEAAVGNNFQAVSTMMMPSYVGMISSVTIGQKTDSVQEVSITFEEVRISGI